jgi:hypothetical protein
LMKSAIYKLMKLGGKPYNFQNSTKNAKLNQPQNIA